MNSKAKFRTTKKWKEFREDMKKLYNNRDAITGEKLHKGWQLHHLDLNEDNYTNLNPEKFIPLNAGTHELLHRNYTFIVKAKNNRVCNMQKYIAIMAKLNK